MSKKERSNINLRKKYTHTRVHKSFVINVALANKQVVCGSPLSMREHIA